jgi:phosphotransferase system HPr-like phosphotransfer protein
MLAAAPGALIDVEVKGEDEETVLDSITQIAAESSTPIDVALFTRPLSA